MINFISKFDSKTDNLGLFLPEEQLIFKNSKIDGAIKDQVNKFLKKIAKEKDKKKIHFFDISEDKRCFVIIFKKKLVNFEINDLGGSFRNLVASIKQLKNISFLASDSLKNKDLSQEKLIAEFLYGYTLKSYSFDKYKTKKKSNLNLILNICTDKPEKFNKEFKKLSFIKEGVFLARDLVSEPPNVLNPKNYTKEILKLTRLGLKVDILNEKKNERIRNEFFVGCWTRKC